MYIYICFSILIVSFCIGITFASKMAINMIYQVFMGDVTDYGRPVRKSPSLHGRKSNPNPKFLGTAEAYFCLPY